VQLLEDMRRPAEAFGTPSYEGELQDFLVESMWKNVRGRKVAPTGDATEEVKRYADLVVAHTRGRSQRLRPKVGQFIDAERRRPR
jgi:hypothetical protein